MTVKELEALLRRFTYKTGSSFRLRRHMDLYMISVSVNCEDVNNPGKFNFVTNEYPVYEIDLRDWTEDLAIARIENAIHSIERHEIQEWLRLDGKFISDPHPEIAHGKNYRPRTGGRAGQAEPSQTPMRPGRV